MGLAATDVLISVCHRVRDEPLELDLLYWEPSSDSHQRAAALLTKILKDDLSKQVLETTPLSLQWKSITLLATEIDLSIADEEDYDDFAHRIPPPLQRFCGALFCTCDFILDCDTKYQPLIQQSLQRIFHQQPQNIMWLFLNYRSLFSYSYMFLRRVGKFEKVSRPLLEQLFNLKPDKAADDVQVLVDDAVEDMNGEDSLIETVLSPVNDIPPIIASNDKASASNPVEAPKQRPSILIRSNSDSAPQRNLSRSVSFSMDVGREGLAHSEGRRSLVDSISRISTQNLLTLDDNVTESTASAPSISPLSAGDSASSFGLEVEELEEDGDEIFIVPRNSEPIKPRVLAEVRTITSSSMLTRKPEFSHTGNEIRGQLSGDDQFSMMPKKAMSIGDFGTPVTSADEHTTTVTTNAVSHATASPTNADGAEGTTSSTSAELFTSDTASNDVGSSSEASSRPPPSASAGGTELRNQSIGGEVSQSAVDSSDHEREPFLSDHDFQQPKRSNTSAVNTLSNNSVRDDSNRVCVDDNDESVIESIRPRRIDSSFEVVSPAKEVSRRPVPSALRKLNSSVGKLERPPLHPNSRSNAFLLASVAMDKSIVVQPRERSDFAYETNTMMEGWMEKKSERTGLWLRVNLLSIINIINIKGDRGSMGLVSPSMGATILKYTAVPLNPPGVSYLYK